MDTFLDTEATIFLFLGLRISWPQKRVGRGKKKKIQNNYVGPIMSSCRKSDMEIVIKSGVLRKLYHYCYTNISKKNKGNI